MVYHGFTHLLTDGDQLPLHGEEPVPEEVRIVPLGCPFDGAEIGVFNLLWLLDFRVDLQA